MKVKASIFLLILPLFVQGQLQLDGFVFDKYKKSPLFDAKVILYSFQYDTIGNSAMGQFHYEHRDTVYKIEQKTNTDSSGYYSFRNLQPGIYKIFVSYRIQKVPRGYLVETDETAGFRISADKSPAHSFYLTVFCPFDLTRSLTECPKCHQSDRLKEIRNGLPSLPLLDTARYFYTFNCSPPLCHPTKICLRCNNEF